MQHITNILNESSSIYIVCNAQNILKSRRGEWIDSFDTVIRMNRGFPKKKKDQGSRTDILALSCSIKEREYQKLFGAPAIAWMTPKHTSIPEWITPEDIDFHPKEYWEILYQKLNENRPSTGAMIIDLLCNYIKPTKLRITGFDFKTTKTLFEKREKLGPHNWDLERDFALQCIAKAKADGLDWDITN